MVCFERHFARANAWTFQIPVIKKLFDKYVPIGDNNWIDPFAGKNSPAQWQNDHNPEMPTRWHMDAEEFCKDAASGYLVSYKVLGQEVVVLPPFDGILFDPPYSYRQISEHYKVMGLKATSLDTGYNFYGRVMNAISPAIKVGGLAISFGWNSNGFGKKRGFKIIDGITVAHGLHHNDTLYDSTSEINLCSCCSKDRYIFLHNKFIRGEIGNLSITTKAIN